MFSSKNYILYQGVNLIVLMFAEGMLSLKHISMNAVVTYGIDSSNHLPTTLWSELEFKKYRFSSNFSQLSFYNKQRDNITKIQLAW